MNFTEMSGAAEIHLPTGEKTKVDIKMSGDGDITLTFSAPQLVEALGWDLLRGANLSAITLDYEYEPAKPAGPGM